MRSAVSVSVRVARVRRVPTNSRFCYSNCTLDYCKRLLRQINRMGWCHSAFSISNQESWIWCGRFGEELAIQWLRSDWPDATRGWLQVGSNSELIYLLINNELLRRNEIMRCVHTDYVESRGNPISVHCHQKKIKIEHELHVFRSQCWKYVNQLQKINIELAFQVIYLQ